MATTFTWTIDRMMTVQQPDPDYVVGVFWTLTGVDGEYSANIIGHTRLEVNDESTEFIPYDQLTPEIVIGWVKDSLGEQGVFNFEDNVNGQIASKKNPPVSPQVTPLPWSAE